MLKLQVPTMAADDPRQYMLNEYLEIYEKVGVPSGALEMHFHNFYEIMYIIEGEFTILVNNTNYVLNSGDFILININNLHHYTYTDSKHENNKRILMWVSKKYLNQLSAPSYELDSCFANGFTPAWRFPPHHREQLYEYMLQLLYISADDNRNKTENKLLQNAYTTLFFVHLNKLCQRKEFSFSPENTYNDPMIRTVSEYINQHIDEPITLDTLAAQVHLSKYHFARLFKETTRMTVRDFIIQKRLILACEKIWAGEPLKNIYSACGFTDYSSFYRNFKSFYGLSPSEYKEFYDKGPAND